MYNVTNLCISSQKIGGKFQILPKWHMPLIRVKMPLFALWCKNGCLYSETITRSFPRNRAFAGLKIKWILHNLHGSIRTFSGDFSRAYAYSMHGEGTVRHSGRC